MGLVGWIHPAAILELLKLPLFDVVFVARSKRKEGLIFLISYFLYRVLFKIFTGHSISYGNYSLISPEVLNGIHKQKFLHYSAFLSKQKYDIRKIVFPRKKRIDGVSKMNYNGLVLHGLKSMIEFSDEFLIFFIKIFFVALFGVFILSGYILYQKFVSNEAILGWASTLGIGLVNACLIIFGTIIISLLLLSLKNTLKQNDNEYIVIK